MYSIDRHLLGAVFFLHIEWDGFGNYCWNIECVREWAREDNERDQEETDSQEPSVIMKRNTSNKCWIKQDVLIAESCSAEMSVPKAIRTGSVSTHKQTTSSITYRTTISPPANSGSSPPHGEKRKSLLCIRVTSVLHDCPGTKTKLNIFGVLSYLWIKLEVS